MFYQISNDGEWQNLVFYKFYKVCRIQLGKTLMMELFLCGKVIATLLAGDQVTVIAAGLEAGEGEDSFFLGDGYTTFVGLQVRSGLEK